MKSQKRLILWKVSAREESSKIKGVAMGNVKPGRRKFGTGRRRGKNEKRAA